MPRIALFAPLALIAFAVGSAFAQVGEHMGGEHMGGEHMAFGQPGAAEDVATTVEVIMEDNAYSLQNLTVASGETVRFILVNKDDADHEFTLGDTAMQAAHRAEMATMNEHAHMHEPAAAQHAMPNMVFVPALETRELIWTFGAGGTIEFACNIPGHYEAGMHGKIEIDEPR